MLIKSMVRGLEIFECLVKENAPLSLNKISEKVKLPLTTTHRFLNTLVYKGYVCRVNDNQYRSTIKLFGLNNLMFLNFHVHNAFRDHLKQLSEQVKLGVHFGILDQGKVLLADVLSSPLMLKVDVPPGTREYLHSTAMGKILLAHMPKDQIKEVIHQMGLPKFTEQTITNEEELYSELAKVREIGFAVDDEETKAQVKCVAVPIKEKDQKVVAALSVAGPTSHIPNERIPELIPILMDSVKKVENLTSELGESTAVY